MTNPISYGPDLFKFNERPTSSPTLEIHYWYEETPHGGRGEAVAADIESEDFFYMLLDSSPFGEMDSPGWVDVDPGDDIVLEYCEDLYDVLEAV